MAKFRKNGIVFTIKKANKDKSLFLVEGNGQKAWLPIGSITD